MRPSATPPAPLIEAPSRPPADSPARRPAAKQVDPPRERALRHYHLCCLSREVSNQTRREVIARGRAKFGITGDGKELAQVALATQFEPGDWRAGYYRDQTLMLALGLADARQLFAQLYADPEGDPFSGGRQMNSHFATATVDGDGAWLPLAETLNVSADISPTAGQMARGLGLAFASKKFRRLPALADSPLSRDGREICWVTIGDASTSEGIFWETMNAAGVLQVPLVVSVWDDGYGISVPRALQTTKDSISAALAGLQREGGEGPEGIHVIRVAGHDYPELLAAYAEAARVAREDHVPVLVHVVEVTQQLGHSTSGSHERYKTEERLGFEREFDCNRRFAGWLLARGYATEEDLAATEAAAAREATDGLEAAYASYRAGVDGVLDRVREILPDDAEEAQDLVSAVAPGVADGFAALRRFRLGRSARSERVPGEVDALIAELEGLGRATYATGLYLPGAESASAVAPEPAEYGDKPAREPGFRLLNRYFESLLERDRRVLAFGEDVGNIGDVNQGFAGLQDKFGEERVFDTGIREWSIVGQAIGLALRGLRPIAEIQYLDYLVYALSPLSDDLATTSWRTDGQQRCPAIIRTRGHRLEGVWHSGSPMQMLLGSLRGVNVCVPRNMLQAVGMYNALMQASEPGLVVETLNGYRLREAVPTNLETYTVPTGRVEVLREGYDVTVLTYGACVAVCEAALVQLEGHGVSVELVDAQTLLPFDLAGDVGASVAKTNRLLIVDEDVPGGASAYLLREVIERQGAFRHLDAAPRTLTAAAHRPPYGSDGDYFTKPSPEDVAEAILGLLAE